jgi:hypothetical protein
VKAYNKLAKKLVAFEYLWHMAWVESVRGLAAPVCLSHCVSCASVSLRQPGSVCWGRPCLCGGRWPNKHWVCMWVAVAHHLPKPPARPPARPPHAPSPLPGGPSKAGGPAGHPASAPPGRRPRVHQLRPRDLAADSGGAVPGPHGWPGAARIGQARAAAGVCVWRERVLRLRAGVAWAGVNTSTPTPGRCFLVCRWVGRSGREPTVLRRPPSRCRKLWGRAGRLLFPAQCARGGGMQDVLWPSPPSPAPHRSASSRPTATISRSSYGSSIAWCGPSFP